MPNLSVSYKASLAAGLTLLATFGVQADTLFTTTSLAEFLIVGKADSSNGETVQSTSDNTFGAITQLPGSAPSVPSPGIAPVVGAPTFDGNVAILDPGGSINLQDTDIFANVGVQCTSSFIACTDGGQFLSNSNFDNNDGNGLRPIGNNPDGITGDVDLSGVSSDIDNIKNTFSALAAGPADFTIETTDGLIDSDTVVPLASGLNVVNFGNAGDSDISLNNANLIFQGAIDAIAVVFIPDDADLLTSNANIVIGDGGIDTNNVVLVTLANDNGSNFNFSNTLINGVALFDLSHGDGSIDFDNVSGCTQLVGDVINLSSQVDLSLCSFDPPEVVVPVPAAVWLFGSALFGLVAFRRKV